MSKQTTDIAVGPYRFTIVDSEQRYNERILGRMFTMGGTYPDCVNVSIQYDAENRPIHASIPYVTSDRDCSKGAPLDRGQGSVLMVKTLLRYVHETIPSITRFSFDDMSNIECGTEEEQRSRRHAKKGTFARPIPLHYFSIAFNGSTWYEKNFNAMYRDEKHHATYRRQVQDFLTEEKMPPFVDFLQQLPNSRSLLENKVVLDELQTRYESAHTVRELFRSLPKERRCAHARIWLISFLEKRLSEVFHNKNWVIDVTRMDDSTEQQGGRQRKKRGTRKRGHSFYVPREVRREGGYSIGHTLDLDPTAIE